MHDATYYDVANFLKFAVWHFGLQLETKFLAAIYALKPDTYMTQTLGFGRHLKKQHIGTH